MSEIRFSYRSIFLLWVSSMFLSKGTESSMINIDFDWLLQMTRSGFWTVTRISVGIVEHPCNELGKSVYTFQCSERSFEIVFIMWVRIELCLHKYLGNMWAQLLRIWCRVSLLSQNEHFVEDLLPHLLRLALVGNVSMDEFTANFKIPRGKLYAIDFHVIHDFSNSSRRRNWPWITRFLIWLCHVLLMSSWIIFLTFFLILPRFEFSDSWFSPDFQLICRQNTSLGDDFISKCCLNLGGSLSGLGIWLQCDILTLLNSDRSFSRKVYNIKVHFEEAVMTAYLFKLNTEKTKYCKNVTWVVTDGLCLH